jgi:O-antigen/teichoic acid export membrane protein
MIKKYLNISLSNRSSRANFHTILSVLFRGGSIFLQFALIPLTINYISSDTYGVWLTISSLVGWVAMFDVGIANGLKNKLSESLAQQNFEKARIYVSTTYVIITLIAVVLMCGYFAAASFVNWQSVFNSKFIPEKNLYNVVSIVSVFFLLKFITDIINTVSASFQMISVSSILVFLSNLCLTLSVWLLTITTKSNLLLLAFFLSAIPFIVSLCANLYLFYKHFKIVRPSIKYLDFKQSSSIISLGSQFFILQIVSLVIFQTDNILIAQLFHPSDVTDFNVAYKYYSIITIVFTLILAPYWSAFTEAYFTKDLNWISKTMEKLFKYWFISLIFLVIMLIFVDYIIELWIGNKVKIPLNLSLSICFYVAISNWNSILASFLNGVGKIRIQIFIAMIVGVFNIPLSLTFVKVFNWSTFAMPAANSVCLALGSLVCYIQYKKIINNDAKGIWNR